MLVKRHFLATAALFISFSTSVAAAERSSCETSYVPSCDKHFCCNGMGGINYCDSSAGRYVCNNGYFSSCYCTRHAVMDIQKLQGCCLWQGGVASIKETTGAVICNNGLVSEVCSFQPNFSVSYW